MEDTIIAIFCFCDDYLKSINHEDWCNVKWAAAEVMTSWIVAMRFFYGNLDRARRFLIEYKYMRLITLSGLNRGVHRLPGNWNENLLKFIQVWGKTTNFPSDYLVDAFPISACRNIRISRCKLYREEMFRGYNASKKEYFYGLKATVITTLEGCPTGVILCPGKEHDNVPFEVMDFSLPEGSNIYGDNGYEDKEHEERKFEL